MTKSRNTRAILISVLVIVLSVAVLTATTLAWFTNSETNKGNNITAGTLTVDAGWYDIDASGTTSYEIGGTTYAFSSTINSFDNSEDATTGQLIAEENWAPGYSNAKLVSVTNTGSLATTISLSATVGNTDLEPALWYDFIAVSNGSVTGTMVEREMSTLSTLISALTWTLESKETIQFILIYGMDTSAGNEYQGKDYTVGISVSATQTDYVADVA